MIISLLSIENNCFPDELKEAQVTPIFKKSDPLMKTNYSATPLWMSAQPLRTLLTFICCFRFDK
jgi:hypothetical protein